jgi:hypothetical protein
LNFGFAQTLFSIVSLPKVIDLAENILSSIDNTLLNLDYKDSLRWKTIEEKKLESFSIEIRNLGGECSSRN